MRYDYLWWHVILSCFDIYNRFNNWKKRRDRNANAIKTRNYRLDLRNNSILISNAKKGGSINRNSLTKY